MRDHVLQVLRVSQRPDVQMSVSLSVPYQQLDEAVSVIWGVPGGCDAHTTNSTAHLDIPSCEIRQQLLTACQPVARLSQDVHSHAGLLNLKPLNPETHIRLQILGLKPMCQGS